MASQTFFPGKLALQQRVLPAYRAAFIEMLGRACGGGLSVFAGEPLPVEGIESAGKLEAAQVAPAYNRNFRDPGSKFYLCWQEGLMSWLKSCQPDGLVVEANPRYLSTPRAVGWMRERGKIVLGWGLGAPPLGGAPGWLLSWRRKALLKTLDGVIAYSQRGAAEYRALGIPAEKVFVAVNAAVPRPPLPPPRPAQFTGQPVVLFVGRLQARKRVDILLHACAALPDMLRPRLVIVGDGPARTELEDMAQAIYPLVEFPGAKFGEELEAFFPRANLFVLPGTGGLALQQAMAHGLPVIAAQGDGTQDDLVRVENGWQIPAGDLESLVMTLKEALSDAPRLRRMGAESYRIVAEEANLEAMVEVFVGALRSLSPAGLGGEKV
jgi:hypothetical protein